VPDDLKDKRSTCIWPS